MQQDSNPHLSFYLKKNCRKIAVSFPIFRTFYLSPPQVSNLETCHLPTMGSASGLHPAGDELSSSKRVNDVSVFFRCF
jgi:hypothetical protein